MRATGTGREIHDVADARETAKAAAQDLAELGNDLPAEPGRREACARICDRLAEDLAELAAWLRRGSTPDGGLAVTLAELRHQWDGFYSIWFQAGEFHAMRRDNGAMCRRADPGELAREVQADYDAMPVLI